MLRLVIAFFIIALIAGILGFGGIAAGAAAIAKIFFYIFIVLFVLSLISGAVRGSSWRWWFNAASIFRKWKHFENQIF